MERPHQDLHLVEIYGPSPRITRDKDLYHQASNAFITLAGFTIMEGSDLVFPYPGQGFTYMAALSESGVTGHTWPGQTWEYEGKALEYANFLLHTCKKDADFSNLAAMAQLAFQAEISLAFSLRPDKLMHYRDRNSNILLRRVVEEFTEPKS